jgi:GxxExxY protein
MVNGLAANQPIDCDDGLVDQVLTAATQVHRTFGPGLLESVYERALIVELDAMGIYSRRQVDVPVSYRGQELGLGFKADVVVENKLLLELKCVDDFSSVHLAQVLTYLKLLNIKRGYLLNFNTKLLKYGIKRVSI